MMIGTGLLLSALLSSSSVADELPQAWRPGVQGRVSVTQVQREKEHRYAFGLTVAERGGASVLARSGLEVETVFGRPADEADKQHAQMTTLWGVAPAISFGADGGLTGFPSEADDLVAARRALAKATGQPPQMLAAQLRSSIFRDAWTGTSERDWLGFGEGWVGVPTTVGEHQRDGRVFVGAADVRFRPVSFTYAVEEPFEEDGRRLVRITRTARIGDPALKKNEFSGYLRAIEAFPSDSRYAQGFRTLFRTVAVFDVETWLPVRVDDLAETHVRMQSPRSNWRETFKRRSTYAFEWGGEAGQ